MGGKCLELAMGILEIDKKWKLPIDRDFCLNINRGCKFDHTSL